MNITILGAGAWGLTLSCLLAKNLQNCSGRIYPALRKKSYCIKLWEFSSEKCKELNTTRIGNIESVSGERFSFKIPEEIKITSEITQAITGKEDIVVFCVPSHFLIDTLKKVKKLNIKFTNTVFLSVIKGLQTETLKPPSEIIIDSFPEVKKTLCVLSGPSFAIEVAKGFPTAVVLASKNESIAKNLQRIFMNEYFRVYTHQDVSGVELGGALKNIFAISCGISDGLGFGDNAKSALITRSMKELVKLGNKLGGKTETFFGLSGLGDLITTCFSRHSRNRAFGEKIGKGKKPKIALNEIKSVVEGYRTTKSAYLLGKKFQLELPIIQEVHSVLYENLNPKLAVKNLMLRSAKSEFE